MKVKSKFGTNLKQIREYLGITQVEFSKRTGIAQAAICQIEKGDREPSLNTVVLITKTLGVTLERLLE